MNDYTPPKKILEKYADVLINFALNNGEGIKKGEVVQISVPDVAKPLAKELYIATLKAGAHPMVRLIPTGFDRVFYTHASTEQLTHFPKKYLQTKAELLDHAVTIIADPDPNELKGFDTKKILLSRETQYPFREWLFTKEHKMKFSWTVGLWGTQAKADIVGLSLKDYWNQIIKACFLDKEDPVGEWQKLTKMQQDIKDALNALDIESVHVLGDDVDLHITIGADRAWKTGSGSNIPSFEHFTSPDWRGTNGWIKFNQPLYRYGNVIEGISLEFKNGIVTKATAKKGKKVLLDMIATKNANKIGEFSLTDNRFSRITHPMAETLFDENTGGPYGNTHIAVGMSYKDCCKDDPSLLTELDFEQRGYNNSSVHTDIISTTDRTVTATLQDGSKKIIYQNGQFTI